MTFKQRPSTYKISVAPTGRARCRKCRQLIPKGATRLEMCGFVRPGRSTVLVRCGACVDTAMASAILRVYQSAERVPVEASVSESEAVRLRDQIKAVGERVIIK